MGLLMYYSHSKETQFVFLTHEANLKNKAQKEILRNIDTMKATHSVKQNDS